MWIFFVIPEKAVGCDISHQLADNDLKVKVNIQTSFIISAK